MYKKQDDKKFERLHASLEKLQRQGAQADILLAESSSMSINRRLGKAESLTRDEEQVIGMRVFVGHKSAIVSSSDTSDKALEQLGEQALAMAKSVPDDAWAGIAEIDETAKDIKELELYDETEVTVEQMLNYADEAEQAALEVKGITNSDGAAFDAEKGRIYYAASNGFSGSYATSDFSISVSVIAGEDENMQTDYDFDSRTFFSDLHNFASVGKEAAQRAVKALNPRKISTGKMPVVFDKRVASSLLRPLASAISGNAIVRGTSFLKNSMNEQIFPTDIAVVDDPFIMRGQRSRPFDGEGLAPCHRNIIDGGILTGWLLDLRSARKLGLKSTGNAVRDVTAPPLPRASNFYISPSKISVEEMISDIKEGVLVTELMGSGADIVTGDYSQGARGFKIENGIITHPVAEITIAGNLKEMWKHMQVADDLELKYGIDTPTIRINNVMVAGN